MNKLFKPLFILSFSILLFLSSCIENEIDNDSNGEVISIVENEWYEADFSDPQEKWYKLDAAETATKMSIEWAEKDYHGEKRSYTADIIVSAYMLDGVTPYFEEKNNGYGASAKTIDLSGEKSVLLKVQLNEASTNGTFAVRFLGINDAGNIEFIDISLSSDPVEGSIVEGESIGYSVHCGDVKKVKIIWLEEGSTETGYTAEIMASVFHVDGTTPYKELENGKDIVNKNNSRSDDPKIIEVIPTEEKIKVVVNVNSMAGTFALIVDEVLD